MRITPTLIIPVTTCFLIWPALVGCHTPPMTYSASQLQSPSARARAAYLYWQRNNVPSLREKDYRRIALVDFSVEYVTAKMEMPGQNQPTFSPPAIAPGHIGLEYSGLFRKKLNFDESLCRQLADELHQMFISHLTRRGFEVVDSAEIRQAPAYQRLETSPRDNGSILQELNLIGSDTGRTKKMIIYPATGLQIVTGADGEDIEDVELDLLDQLHADVSLRVHIRVGVYQDHASIERGSIIWILTRDVVGNSTANRSLLSDNIVVTPRGFAPLQGEVYDVDSHKYLQAIRLLFPVYISMAIEPELY